MKNHKLSFAIRALSLYLLWWFFYQVLQKPSAFLDQPVIHFQTKLAQYLLEYFNYVVHTQGEGNYMNTIWIEGSAFSLKVLDGCNALEILAIFSIFLLAYPTKLTHKLWIFPGLLLLLLINVGRIIALVLVEYYASAWLDFNHKYTFTLLMYLIIIAMWYTWIKYTVKNTDVIE